MAVSITDYDVQLGTVYGFDYTDVSTLVSDRYMDYATATADLPGLALYWNTNAFPHGDLMDMYYSNAAHLDAKYQTDGYMGDPPSLNNTSRARLFWPHGGYQVNHPLYIDQGWIVGKGSEQSTQLGVGAGPGTQFLIDKTNWLTTEAPLYNAIQSSNFGDTSLLTYNQGTTIMDVYVSGGAPDLYDNSYESNGIALWSPGSNSGIWRCRADKFNNYGFLFAFRPTPGAMYGCRSFYNNLGGAAIVGGGVVNVYNFETDDNPAAFVGRSGYTIADADAICRFYVDGWKGETGTLNAYGIRKGQCLLDSEAWTTCTFNGVGYVGYGYYPELLCRVKTTANVSSVTMTGLSTYGYVRTLMHDVSNGKKFFVDGPEYGLKFGSGINSYKWSSANGGTLYADDVKAPHIPVPYENRQDPLAADGMTGAPVPPLWDDTVIPGTPVYTF